MARGGVPPPRAPPAAPILVKRILRIGELCLLGICHDAPPKRGRTANSRQSLRTARSWSSFGARLRRASLQRGRVFGRFGSLQRNAQGQCGTSAPGVQATVRPLARSLAPHAWGHRARAVLPDPRRGAPRVPDHPAPRATGPRAGTTTRATLHVGRPSLRLTFAHRRSVPVL